MLLLVEEVSFYYLYLYFTNFYKLIAVDLNKHQKLDADPKAEQRINFTGNTENNASRFFIIE